MTPTPELRFVERSMSVPVVGQLGVWTFVTRTILQQKWETSDAEVIRTAEYKSEWRDVPCVKEEA